MLRPIRYYCPPGIARPEHRDDLVGGAGLVLGAGPDVEGGGPGGGTVYGGVYEAREPGWVLTAAGWWVHLGDVVPQHLARLDVHPRITRWTIVDGAHAQHRWRVPVLLTPNEKDPGAVDASYGSALERVLAASGWADPADLAALQARLLDQVYGLARGADLRAELDNITDLVVKLFELGHRVTRHELVVGGWLTERVLVRTLIAAADVPLPEVVA